MSIIKFKNAIIQREIYEYYVKDTTCSWRKKSSYKKPIKRRVSKLLRKFVKNQTVLEYNNL